MKKEKKMRGIFAIFLFFIGMSLILIEGYLSLSKSKMLLTENLKDDVGANNIENYKKVNVGFKGIDGKVTNRNIHLVHDGETYVVAYNSVMDSKFKADNTGKTDSTKAFNDAISAAQNCTNKESHCGNLVYIPEGKYILKGKIDVKAYTGLIGAGPDKTILYIEHEDTAVSLQKQSSIRGVSFYYPNQKKENGKIISYKPTISGVGFAEIENINFINSYIAMDFGNAKNLVGNRSLIFINNIYGTPLKTGLINDGNTDTIKINNINFSPKYWLDYEEKHGTLGEKDSDNIKKILKNSDNKPTGIELQRVDWAFLSKINIVGYYNGIYLNNSVNPRSMQPDYKNDNDRHARDAEGEIYDSNITDCVYPINIYNSRHFTITDSILSSTGGTGLYIKDNVYEENKCKNNKPCPNVTLIDKNDVYTNYSIYKTEITGPKSIDFGGRGTITITNSKIIGRINKIHPEAKMSITNSGLTNTLINDCNLSKAEPLSYDKITDYSKKVVRSYNVSDKSVIVVSNPNSFTNDLVAAINSLNGKGGIIYIPTGLYTLTSTVTVPSGVEIVGSTPWMHNGALLYQNGLGSTRITLSNNVKIQLMSDSELNGLEIVKTDNDYAIVSTGNNPERIYVRNVSLPGVKKGIYIKGNNFVVEHIWGAIEEEGIKVQGNLGIVRNCHFTKNARLNKEDTSTEKLYEHNNTYIVIGIKNIIYNDFSFGPNVGFTFDTSSDTKVVGIGVDSSSIGVEMKKFSGQIINAMLVSHHKKNDNYYFKGTNLKENSSVRIINPVLWSGDNGTKVLLEGKANVYWIGGLYEKHEAPSISTNSPRFVLAGVSFQNVAVEKIKLLTGVKNAYIYGNICNNNLCTEKSISNIANATIDASEPKSTCGNNSATYNWENLNLSNTTTKNKQGTTKVCNLGTTYNKFIYYTKGEEEKIETIKNGCVTITVPATSDQYLNYKLINSTTETTMKTVKNIGKYLIYAQEYNKFLFASSTNASNNSDNLGGWVNKSEDVSAIVKRLGEKAIPKIDNKTDEEFIRMLYRGVLGREVDTGDSNSGMSIWKKFLNNNKTKRKDMLYNIVDSAEAKAIYSAWGYK